MSTAATWKLAEKKFEKFRFSRDIMRDLAKLRPDNITGALYIVKDYAVMLLCALVTIYGSWWFYPVAVVLIGAHQRGLTTISHDAAHRILAKTSWWNNFLGVTFAAYPIFQRHWAYRVSHVHLHHPHLGNPGKDPDLQFFLESGVYKVEEPKKYKNKLILGSIFGGATVRYLKYLWTNRFLVSDSEETSIKKSSLAIDLLGFILFWFVVLAAVFALDGAKYFLLFWLVPYLTAFQVLGWFVEIAEHSPMCETENENVYLTRNRKGNLIERILFGVNFDEYHLEHHLSPGIPFWRLKEAQEIRLRDPRYAELADTWGGLFVKGPKGQASVISQLLERNRKLWEVDQMNGLAKESQQ